MAIQSKSWAAACIALALSAAVPAQGAGARVKQTEKARPGAAKAASSRSSDAESAQLRPVLGFGPGFFWEDTDRKTEAEQGGAFFQSNEEEELVSDGKVSLHAWALFPVFFKRLYFGGGIGWYNKYAIKPGEENNGNDESYEIGQMFAIFAQVEFLVPQVVSKLNVVLGLRGGGLLAFPGGELQDDLERRDRTGYSVTPGLPRTGGFVGPHIGVSWPLTEKLRIRSDFSAQFSSLSLWDGSAEAAGITSTTTSDLETLRCMVLVGPELMF